MGCMCKAVIAAAMIALAASPSMADSSQMVGVTYCSARDAGKSDRDAGVDATMALMRMPSGPTMLEVMSNPTLYSRQVGYMARPICPQYFQ